MSKIHDEFTDLKVSRQRKYQLRKIKLGLCRVCGNPIVTSYHCRYHADQANKNTFFRKIKLEANS